MQKYCMRRSLFIGLNTSVQQRLNDLNPLHAFCPGELLMQLDQDEIITILDWAKDSEYHEAVLVASIDIFEMSYEEYVSFFSIWKMPYYQ